MTSPTLQELRRRSDAAWTNLRRQLEGMEPYLDRPEAPGEWSARDVLSHLLGADGVDIVATLRRFAPAGFPPLEFRPGESAMTPARRAMTLPEILAGLDAQRRAVFGYLEGLPESDLAVRKIRMPAFKRFMGTDEISLAMFAGAMLDFHWNDHAGQLAKIRKAAGLPDAGP